MSEKKRTKCLLAQRQTHLAALAGDSLNLLLGTVGKVARVVTGSATSGSVVAGSTVTGMTALGSDGLDLLLGAVGEVAGVVAGRSSTGLRRNNVRMGVWGGKTSRKRKNVPCRPCWRFRAAWLGPWRRSPGCRCRGCRGSRGWARCCCGKPCPLGLCQYTVSGRE